MILQLYFEDYSENSRIARITHKTLGFGTTPLDYDRMLKIVKEAGFRGYCGIEHGGFAGLNASREKLEAARERLAG